jgi:hypothetical protein
LCGDRTRFPDLLCLIRTRTHETGRKKRAALPVHSFFFAFCIRGPWRNHPDHDVKHEFVDGKAMLFADTKSKSVVKERGFREPRNIFLHSDHFGADEKFPNFTVDSCLAN